MDDTDDKIRRNLVVVSALVLLACWLDLPLDDVAKKVLGVDGGTIDPRKVWTAVVLLLLYLGLRYRFCEETGKSFAVLRNEVHSEIAKRVRRALHSDVALFGRRGVLSKLFAGGLAEAEAAHRGDSMFGLEPGTLRCTAAELSGLEFGRSLWEGRASFSFIRETSRGQRVESSGGQGADFLVPVWRRREIALSAAVHVGLYSRGSTLILVPVAIGAAALAAALLKLVSSLLA